MTQDDDQELHRTQQLARLGAVFAGFAHEIRNPLSTIGLNLQLVKEDMADATTSRERRNLRRLTVVESEAKRLQSILDEFLGFVRVPKLEIRPVPLNSLLAELVEFVLPEASAREVELRMYADGNVNAVPVDGDKFRAVVVNLLRNALDACDAGDEIMVATRLTGNSVVVLITDTGCGMTAEVRKNAFDPYFSTKKNGTGLGLPTARRMIELHGGSLELHSEPDHGTQFLIRLPTPPVIEAHLASESVDDLTEAQRNEL